MNPQLEWHDCLLHVEQFKNWFLNFLKHPNISNEPTLNSWISRLTFCRPRLASFQPPTSISYLNPRPIFKVKFGSHKTPRNAMVVFRLWTVVVAKTGSLLQPVLFKWDLRMGICQDQPWSELLKIGKPFEFQVLINLNLGNPSPKNLPLEIHELFRKVILFLCWYCHAMWLKSQMLI